MALTVRFSIKIAIVMMMLSILRSFNTRIITTRNSLAIDTISSLSKSTTFLSLYSPFTSESEPGLRRRIFSDKKTVDDRKEDNRSKFSHLRMSNVYKTASSSRLQESSKGSSTDSNGIKNRSIPFRSKPLQSSTISDVDGENDETKEKVKDRPFTLPPGEFRPKQSLGQNFLSDQNYVLKIVDAFSDDSENGKNVVEIGPGPGN